MSKKYFKFLFPLNKTQGLFYQENISRLRFLAISFLLVLMFTLTYYYVHHYYLHFQQTRHTLEERIYSLEAELETYEKSQEYELRKMNVTKYAPLDEEAVEGMDFAGRRKITASGEKVVPGETAAAGTNIPFGTRIYVENKGWYTVNDRGGGIGKNDIDLAVEEVEEAEEFGERDKLIIIEKP